MKVPGNTVLLEGLSIHQKDSSFTVVGPLVGSVTRYFVLKLPSKIAKMAQKIPNQLTTPLATKVSQSISARNETKNNFGHIMWL